MSERISSTYPKMGTEVYESAVRNVSGEQFGQTIRRQLHAPRRPTADRKVPGKRATLVSRGVSTKSVGSGIT